MARSSMVCVYTGEKLGRYGFGDEHTPAWKRRRRRRPDAARATDGVVHVLRWNRDRAARLGANRANRWYRQEVRSFVVTLAMDRMRGATMAATRPPCCRSGPSSTR